MSKGSGSPRGYNLDRPCRTCGRLLRDHIWSRCSCRIYLRPCRELIARIFPEEWRDHVSADGQNCILCGEDMMDHFRFEAFAVEVLGKQIELHREITVQAVKSWIGCPSR